MTVTGAALLGGSFTNVQEAGTGTTDLKAGGSMSGIGDNLLLDGGRLLKNEGVFAWQGGVISLGQNNLGPQLGSATIDNAAGATFDDQLDSRITQSAGTNLITNEGTFKKSAGSSPPRFRSRSTTPARSRPIPARCRSMAVAPRAAVSCSGAAAR